MLGTCLLISHSYYLVIIIVIIVLLYYNKNDNDNNDNLKLNQINILKIRGEPNNY